jgi:hypothetical protein
MSAPIHVRRPAGVFRATDTNSLPPRKEDTGYNAMKNRRFGEDALELIMRDVLEGLQDFTRQASLASKRDGIEILGIENGHPKEKPAGRILYFPRRNPTN